MTFYDRELDAVEAAVEAFGEHIRGEGICGPAIEVSPEATRQDRVIALTGRTPA